MYCYFYFCFNEEQYFITYLRKLLSTKNKQKNLRFFQAQFSPENSQLT